MRIDNKRISSLVPRKFAAYPGLTYLFVNQGRTMAERAYVSERDGPESVPDLRADVSSPELSLYTALHEALLQFEPLPGSGSKGIAILAEDLGICTMPSATYHVTVCDLLHEENISPDADSLRESFSEEMQTLPPKRMPCLPRAAPLPIELCAPVGFRFASLGLRGAEAAAGDHSAALVAYLAPLPWCSAEYERLENERKRIDDEWEPFGRNRSGPWTPHVTLGYAAYRYYFDPILKLIAVWEPLVRAATDGKSIEFNQMGGYAFADMASFWRCPVVSAARSGGE